MSVSRLPRTSNLDFGLVSLQTLLASLLQTAAADSLHFIIQMEIRVYEQKHATARSKFVNERSERQVLHYKTKMLKTSHFILSFILIVVLRPYCGGLLREAVKVAISFPWK